MDKNKLAKDYVDSTYSKWSQYQRDFATTDFLAGFDAAESIANAKIQELEQHQKDMELLFRQQQETITALSLKEKELEQQLKKAESVRVNLIQTTNKLERMITKSNGISFYTRDSYQRELLNREFAGLVEMIESMYDFQCETEQYLKSRGE